MINKLVIYDIETNGFLTDNPNPCVVELAMIIVTPIGIKTYNELVKYDYFGRPLVLSEENIKVHGITNSMLELEGIALKDVVEEFNAETKDAHLVVGHNIVRFDNLFMKLVGGRDVTNITFDTGGEFKSRQMNWTKFPNDSFNKFHAKILDVPRRIKWGLDTACLEYGLPIEENRHRAIVDVRMTARLFLYEWELYKHKYIINTATLNYLNQYLLKFI